MRIILLAAGSGNRMKPLTEHHPKILLPVGRETLLGRLVRQIRSHGAMPIQVLVGYKQEAVRRELDRLGDPKVTIVANPDWETDTNINSVRLGLRGAAQGHEPVLIFEGDLILDDAAMARVLETAAAGSSVWYTWGGFEPHQVGGILRASPDAAVTDLRLVKGYSDEFRGYKKLLGILAVGAKEVAPFGRFVEEASRRSMSQYYLSPWIEHLGQLPAREVDVGAFTVGTFNTPDEYEKVRARF